MSFFTGFAVYFVIWWLTLFIVLPYGNRSQAEDGEVIQGTDPGAPQHSRIVQKLIWNSIVAGIVFAAYWIVTRYTGWSFSDIPTIIPENPGE
jgi:predicted secreted protein